MPEGKTRYIVAGDEMKRMMAGEVPEDDIIPFREDLSKGSREGFSIGPSFLAERAAFWGVPEEEYREKLAPVIGLDLSDSYILRFGRDDCCRANLEFLKGYLRDRGYERAVRVEIVDEYDLTLLEEYEFIPGE